MTSINTTTLPSKNNRDGYIHFLEQGLLIAAMLYRNGLPANCTIATSQRAIEGEVTPVINIDLRLPCAATSLKSGKFLDALTTVVRRSQFPPSVIPTAPTVNPLPIPAEPSSSVNNHEKYLVWLAQTIQEYSTDKELCQCGLLVDNRSSNVHIKASLPYDDAKYKETRNLFESVKQVITSAPAVDLTSLFLTFEGTDGSQVITDAKGNTILCTGTTAISTEQFKAGSSSLKCGSALIEVVGSENNDAFKFAGEFTWEMWVYPTSTSLNSCNLITKYGSDTEYGLYLQHNQRVNLDLARDESSVPYNDRYLGAFFQVPDWENSNSIKANQWQHFALTRDSSNVIRFFLDGVPSADTLTYAHPLVGLGSTLKLGTTSTVIYIDNLNMEKTCKYTAQFTPTVA